METERDCEEAIRSLDKKNIDGKLIRVEMAKGKTREHRENNRGNLLNLKFSFSKNLLKIFYVIIVINQVI